MIVKDTSDPPPLMLQNPLVHQGDWWWPAPECCRHFEPQGEEAWIQTNKNKNKDYKAVVKSNVRKKMAAVHFTTMPREPNTACKAQKKSNFYSISLCTMDIE